MKMPDSSQGINRGPDLPPKSGADRELGAVVVMVSVTGTLVAEEVSATEPGLNVQLLSEGRLEHIVAESVAEPVKPFWAVNVNVVDPDLPGLDTLITGRLAASVKVCPTPITVAGEVDPT